jgi:hypothetical protein
MSLRHAFEAEPLQPDSTTAGSVEPGTHFRQGDVLLLAIDPHDLPRSARPEPRAGGRVVLAEGEATGHAHAIRSAAATLLRDGGGTEAPRFLRATAPVDLVHEEHATIALPAGAYRMVIQREYVPPDVSAIAFRRVVD